MRTLRQRSGNVGFDPTHRSSAPSQPDQHPHDRTPWRPRPFQTSRVVLPRPWGEGWGEGEGITLSFAAFFSAAGSGLNSTENSEELKTFAKMNRLRCLTQRFPDGSRRPEEEICKV